MKDHERNTDRMNGKTIIGSLFYWSLVEVFTMTSKRQWKKSFSR